MGALQNNPRPSKGRGKGGRKKLALRARSDSQSHEIRGDAMLVIGQIILAWTGFGGYIGIYQSSDGGVLMVMLKHDDFDDEKIPLRDNDDVYDLWDDLKTITGAADA